jgi:hemerythrin
MAFFVWTDKYSVGVQRLDDQHKQLLEMVGTLYDAMKAGRGNEVLGTVFGNLMTYVRTHFAEEEKLLQESGYPGFPEHKLLHEQFTKQALDLTEQFKTGKGSLTVHLASFLKEWIVAHIQGTDQKYMPYLAEKGIR